MGYGTSLDELKKRGTVGVEQTVDADRHVHEEKEEAQTTKVVSTNDKPKRVRRPRKSQKTES